MQPAYGEVTWACRRIWKSRDVAGKVRICKSHVTVTRRTLHAIFSRFSSGFSTRLARASFGCHADTCERHVSDCHETVRRHESCDSQETRTLHAICTRFSSGFCTRLAHACDGCHADAYGRHVTRLSRDSQETKIFARDFSRDFCKGFI